MRFLHGSRSARAAGFSAAPLGRSPWRTPMKNGAEDQVVHQDAAMAAELLQYRDFPI